MTSQGRLQPQTFCAFLATGEKLVIQVDKVCARFLFHIEKTWKYYIKRTGNNFQKGKLTF